MRRPSTFFTLALVVSGCGSAAPEPEPVRSSGDETVLSTSNDATRSSDELARDPAWEQVPPDERHATEDSVSVRVDTSEGEVAPGIPLCSGACSEGALCTNERGWRCECVLQHDVLCGGAWRAPNPPVLGYVCAPTDPHTDRGDGCPFAAPSEGGRCVARAQACTYVTDGCGDRGTNATCSGGRWHLEHWAQPPRP